MPDTQPVNEEKLCCALAMLIRGEPLSPQWLRRIVRAAVFDDLLDRLVTRTGLTDHPVLNLQKSAHERADLFLEQSGDHEHHARH